MIFGLFDFAGRRDRKLREAVKLGRHADAAKLLAKGADANARDPDGGDTPLVVAAFANHRYLVDALLRAGADPNGQSLSGNTPLFSAASQGDAALPVVAGLLAAGANPDLGPQTGDNAGATPLYVAATRGATRLMQALHTAGANTTVAMSSGLTLMHAIAKGGAGEHVALLCGWGVSVRTQSAAGITPLAYASLAGNLPVVQALLAAGAELEARDAAQRTPLMVAALNNQPDVVRELLARGANPHVQAATDGEPMTALLGAVVGGHEAVVRLLLDGGADIEAEPRRKHSLLVMARGAGHEPVVKVLESHKRKLRRQAAALTTSGTAGKVSAGKVREGTSDLGVQTTPTGARKRASAVELGVVCASLRYDEHEHGKQFSKVFAKARAAWVASKNDTTSPHYARACKLLTEWFLVAYRVPSGGFSMTFGLNEDNEIDRLASVGGAKDSTDAVAQAFAAEPQLKLFEVVRVDFRTSTSHHPLRAHEPLGQSPEIGALAIYQVKPGRKLGSAQALSNFLGTADALLNDCFAVQIKDTVLQTVEVDEDGDTYTSFSSTYSGGDVVLEVNVAMAGGFRDHLARQVHRAHHSPALLGDEVPEAKRLILLADEAGLQARLDGGLDVDTTVDGESLLKLALMLAMTAGTWFNHEELCSRLQQSFPGEAAYAAALKRIAQNLLDRGADVNATGGVMPVLSIAEALNDPDILAICRARANSVDDAHATPLLLAAERGDAASLQTLLDRGARINKREPVHGTTPLMIASQGPDGEDAPPLSGQQLANQEAAVRLLIARGARLDARSNSGDTAIGNAVRRGNTSIVQLLLDAGARTTEALPRDQSLIDMARSRNHQAVIALLQAGGQASSKVRAPSPPKLAGARAKSTAVVVDPAALLAAIQAGQQDRVKALLEAGADPLWADDKGVPVFLVPALTDNADMQRTLLTSGVSPDLAAEPGQVTALMVASARGNQALCDILLDAGADIDKSMGSGEPFFSHPQGISFEMPALGCAVDSQHWDLASHLLGRGARPSFGVMHTHIALTLAKFAPVALIEKMHGAGYSIVMDHEFRMLFAPPVEMQLPQMRSKVVFWAAVNPDPAVLPWVLDHGADPMAGNALGMTALVVAAAAGNGPLVERLLMDGADADAEDCDGDTALSLAVERGRHDVVKLLRRHGAQKHRPAAPAASLHQAAAQGALGWVLDELDKGVSPNQPDADGNTPLMLAAQAGQVGTVRALFALGASVRSRNAKGQSAWDLAAGAPDARVRVSLREFNADDPKRRDPDERFDPLEQAQGRYAHPFKFPPRTP